MWQDQLQLFVVFLWINYYMELWKQNWLTWFLIDTSVGDQDAFLNLSTNSLFI
jgi:hypothetical protein